MSLRTFSRLWLCAVLLGAFAACTAPSRRTWPAPTVEGLLARLTLEEKIAQLMVVGFDGTTCDAGLAEMIEKFHIGGVIYFARSVESPAQLAKLSNKLQARSLAAGGAGLFIAIDQEGGRVARLTLDKGFTEFPGAMALGATADAVKNSRRVATAMATEMQAVGVNTDFAPTLDVNNNPANPVIGIRSFGSDPQRVAALGTAFAAGLQSAGVLAFGKHFPGHGDTGTDSHLDLPVVAHARARLEAVEFVPFRAAIAGGIAGIMSAHISFPAIEDTPGLPATLSPRVLTQLLREELHFDGLIATDSLEMGALGQAGFPAPSAAAHALAAGADLLLFNRDHVLHQAAIREIATQIRAGKIPLARLDEAVGRVLRAKARFGLLAPAPANPAKAAAICAAPAHRALAAECAAAAVTLLRDEAHLLPLARGVTPVVIAVPSAAKLGELLNAEPVRVAEQPGERDLAAALQAVRAHPGAPVIITLAGARASPGQRDLAKKIIATGAPVILVAVREPYDLMEFSGGVADGPALLATYGANPVALTALAAVLHGKAKPAGHLPVELPNMYALGTGLENFR